MTDYSPADKLALEFGAMMKDSLAARCVRVAAGARPEKEGNPGLDSKDSSAKNTDTVFAKLAGVAATTVNRYRKTWDNVVKESPEARAAKMKPSAEMVPDGDYDKLVAILEELKAPDGTGLFTYWHPQTISDRKKAEKLAAEAQAEAEARRIAAEVEAESQRKLAEEAKKLAEEAKVNAEQWAALKEIGEANDRSATWVMRYAIAYFVENYWNSDGFLEEHVRSPLNQPQNKER